MLRIAGLLVGALAVLVVALAVRTLTYGGAPASSNIALADPIVIDGDAAAERLGEAIRFRTLATQDGVVDRAPFDAFHAWLNESYPLAHQAMEREFVADLSLLYVWEGSNPDAQPIAFLAHQDVVPIANEAAWSTDPFGGILRDGIVWGRGAIDDKGNLIALMEAVETLIGQGFVPSRTIYIGMGHDEEVGGTGAQAMAQWMVGG